MTGPSPMRAAVAAAVTTAALSTAMPAWAAAVIALAVVAGWLTGHPSHDQSLDALARTTRRIREKADRCEH